MLEMWQQLLIEGELGTGDRMPVRDVEGEDDGAAPEVFERHA
jgi:hypothetical protein